MDELTVRANDKTIRRMADRLTAVADLLRKNGVANPWHVQEVADEITRIEYKITMAVHG